MKFFAIAVFALAAAVTCVLGTNVTVLSENAKKISAKVTELHTVIGHIPPTGIDPVFIAQLGNAATSLISILKHATVNVQHFFHLYRGRKNLVGAIAPIKVETVSTLQELEAQKGLLQSYEDAIVVLLQELVHITDAYADAYLKVAPASFFRIISQLKSEIDGAYSACIDFFRA